MSFHAGRDGGEALEALRPLLMRTDAFDRALGPDELGATPALLDALARAGFEDVRRRGFALQNEEREEDIRAVSAPFSSPYPLAAVCLAGPSSRLGSGDLEGRLAGAARAAAGEIAALLFNAGPGLEGEPR